jgi:hypothetical protein
MEQGAGIEDNGIGPGAVFDLESVHGTEDVRHLGCVAPADEADDPGAFPDALRERFVDFGMKVGPAGRALAVDLIENDLTVARQNERLIQARHPTGRPGIDVVLLGHEAVFVSWGEIEQ